MIMLPLLTAQRMGIDVGKHPRVAMTTPGNVVFIDELRDRWTLESTREARRMVGDFEGDVLLVPPFEVKA